MKINKPLKLIALAPFLIWIVILIIVPLLLIVYYAFTSTDGALTTEHFRQFFRPDYMRVLWRSLYLALISTVLCLFIGYPVALILSGNTFKKKNDFSRFINRSYVDEFPSQNICLAYSVRREWGF